MNLGILTSEVHDYFECTERPERTYSSYGLGNFSFKRSFGYGPRSESSYFLPLGSLLVVLALSDRKLVLGLVRVAKLWRLDIKGLEMRGKTDTENGGLYLMGWLRTTP